MSEFAHLWDENVYANGSGWFVNRTIHISFGYTVVRGMRYQYRIICAYVRTDSSSSASQSVIPTVRSICYSILATTSTTIWVFLALTLFSSSNMYALCTHRNCHRLLAFMFTLFGALVYCSIYQHHPPVRLCSPLGDSTGTDV